MRKASRRQAGGSSSAVAGTGKPTNTGDDGVASGYAAPSAAAVVGTSQTDGSSKQRLLPRKGSMRVTILEPPPPTTSSSSVSAPPASPRGTAASAAAVAVGGAAANAAASARAAFAASARAAIPTSRPVVAACVASAVSSPGRSAATTISIGTRACAIAGHPASVFSFDGSDGRQSHQHPHQSQQRVQIDAQGGCKNISAAAYVPPFPSSSRTYRLGRAQASASAAPASSATTWACLPGAQPPPPTSAIGASAAAAAVTPTITGDLSGCIASVLQQHPPVPLDLKLASIEPLLRSSRAGHLRRVKVWQERVAEWDEAIVAVIQVALQRLRRLSTAVEMLHQMQQQQRQQRLLGDLDAKATVAGANAASSGGGHAQGAAAGSDDASLGYAPSVAAAVKQRTLDMRHEREEQLLRAALMARRPLAPVFCPLQGYGSLEVEVRRAMTVALTR